jgi:hypothetical protein
MTDKTNVRSKSDNFTTILASALKNSKVPSAYYKLITLKESPITEHKPTK